MGDNRPQSTDCRRFGCIPLEKIEGKVKFRFWPLNVFGKIVNKVGMIKMSFEKL